MSKASKLARAQKNVPAVSQRILTKANKISNTTTSNVNTRSPVEGTINTDDAFFLVEEATDALFPPTAGIAMYIDDLTLSYKTSYVRLTMRADIDTTDGNVAVGFKIQRSTTGATKDATSGWDDLDIAATYTSSRIRVTNIASHGHGDRNMGNGDIDIIDMEPGTLTPYYRVLLHVYPGHSALLNREYTDRAGNGIGNAGTLNRVLRSISDFSATEIINY